MKKLSLAAASLWFCLLACNSFGQATNWWDNNGASPATSGTWDTTTSNWSLSSALTASTVAFTNGNFPEFAAGTTPISALTITVNSPVTCAGMATGFSGTLVVTNITFSGSGSIGLVSGADNINCDTGSFTYKVPVTGSGQMVQHGTGFIYLAVSNSYSGGTVVTGDQVVYYGTNASFGTGAISVQGSGNALVNDTSPAAALTISNAFSFPTAGYAINLAGGNPVSGAPGTTFSGPFSLPSGTTTIETSSTSTEITEISGVISGSGAALTVSDDGALWLGGVNTYTGNTTISSPAVVAIVGSGSLGSGAYSANITDNGTFIYNSSAAQTLSGVISGTGKVIEDGSGTLTLSGANTYTNVTMISSGNLSVNSIADSGSSAIGNSSPLTFGTNSSSTGETLTYTSTTPATTGRNVVINGGTGTLAKFVLTTNLTLTGTVSGGGTPEVNSGTLILTSPATYGGRTQTDTNGTIVFSGNSSLDGGSYAHNIVNNGTFVWSSTANQVITSGSGISGTGFLIQNGPGTLTVSNSANTFSGITIVSNGILQEAYDRSLGNDPASFQSTNIILAGGTLQGVPAVGNFAFAPNRGITLTANSGISSIGYLNEAAPANGETGVQGPITDDGAGYGITITGNTNLTTGIVSGVYLEGTNTYLGPTVIQSGILSLFDNGSISNSSGISIAAGAGLDVSSNFSNPWNLNQPLTASGSALGLPGYATVAPTSASVMIGFNGGSVNFGAQPLFFNLTPTAFAGDGIHPSLYLSQGALAVNGNVIAVTNLGTSPLGFGSYTLIQQASGSVITSAQPALLNSTVYGNGMVGNGAAAISVSGGSVNLVVYPTDSSTFFANLTPSPTITYSTPSVTLNGTVVSTNGGVAAFPSMGDTVNITIPGVNGGSPVAVKTTDAFGDFTYTFAANALAAGNYVITFNYPSGQSLNPGTSATDTSRALIVEPAALVITANPQMITYGTTVPATTLTYSGFVNGETNTALTTQPTIASAKSSNTNAAGIYAGNYTVSGAVDANYAISYVSGNLTINQEPLVITANPQTITNGTPVPTTTLTYSGFVLGQTNTALTTQPTITSAESGVVSAGVYTNNYTVSGAVDANYNISYVPGNLTVISTSFSITNVHLDGLGNIILTWQSTPSSSYQVVGTTNLIPPVTWTNVGSAVVASGASTSATNPVGGSVNFYSVTTP